ncbi:hypothetical protein AUC71_04310 [Methyloceanibacter marginalis]|uniref:Uncharacterized protein n=1 Tax=Methyloceanibacter marginalis TaxID=1774971 RepID=A0A1E3VV37_9HYPH|nr:hypothetical protein [Methyloceanibacter marginalis]ODR96796.1 hypothetical protein AUC71_04310 [Methyloceanibacter marginalis]
MMPCLSRRALKEAAWVFKESVSGYGVDLLLGAYLSRRFGIDTFVIGSVVATHQRPIDQRDGAFYKFLRSQRIDPLEELRVITKLFGLSLEIYRIRLL